MAGRVIRVISAHVSRGVEQRYGMRTEAIRQFTFWKRLVRRREEPKFQHEKSNYWTQQHAFFMFFMLLGNGFDAMPYSMRFALRISGGLFLIYELFFSMLFTFPILYTEMFLGHYSRLTNTQMYRMMPISFGICVLSLFQDVLYVALSSPAIGMALMGALDHLLRNAWSCPANSPICYDYKIDGAMNKTCIRKHILLRCEGEDKLMVTMYLYWKDYLKRHNFQANWKLIIMVVITWIFIMLIINFKMKILELFLKILTILTLLMHLVLFLLAITTEGSSKSLLNMYDFKIRTITPNSLILSAFLMPVRHNVLYGGGYMTYAASIKYNVKFGLATNTILLLSANFAVNIYFLTVFHAIIGVVGHRTGINYKEVFFPSVGMYYALVSEFLRSMNCPHIFISIYHLTNWLLECAKLTIIIRMHINGLYDFFPAIVQFKAQTRVAWVGVCTFIGLLDTMGICVKLLNEILWMANLYMMNSFQLFIRGLLLFYGYGVSRLNDDIHFYSGKRPIQFWRMVWYIYPFLLFVLLIALFVDGMKSPEKIEFITNDFEESYLVTKFWIISFAFCILIFCGLFVISFLYVVLQMRQSKQITLTTPLYHWGPPNKEDRMARKAFTPRVAIRSQKPKKQRQRFRDHSVRQQHEREFAEKVKRGRLFLDKQFFSNLGINIRVSTNKEPKLPKKSKFSTYSFLSYIGQPGKIEEA